LPDEKEKKMSYCKCEIKLVEASLSCNLNPAAQEATDDEEQQL